MTERQALLRAVLESPLDDGPRLIYADWLVGLPPIPITSLLGQPLEVR